MRRTVANLLVVFALLGSVQPLVGAAIEPLPACCHAPANASPHCHSGMVTSHQHAATDFKLHLAGQPQGCDSRCCCDLMSHGSAAAVSSSLVSGIGLHRSRTRMHSFEIFLSAQPSSRRDRGPPVLA
jgi:hypothetical protein